MQIPSLSNNIQTVAGANARADGSQQNSQDLASQGQSDESLQVTGQTSSSEAVKPPEESTREAAVSENQTAASTQVVTSTDEVLGTTLGLNVDVTV